MHLQIADVHTLAACESLGSRCWLTLIVESTLCRGTFDQLFFIWLRRSQAIDIHHQAAGGTHDLYFTVGKPAVSQQPHDPGFQLLESTR